MATGFLPHLVRYGRDGMSSFVTGTANDRPANHSDRSRSICPSLTDCNMLHRYTMLLLAPGVHPSDSQFRTMIYGDGKSDSRSGPNAVIIAPDPTRAELRTHANERRRIAIFTSSGPTDKIPQGRSMDTEPCKIYMSVPKCGKIHLQIFFGNIRSGPSHSHTGPHAFFPSALLCASDVGVISITLGPGSSPVIFVLDQTGDQRRRSVACLFEIFPKIRTEFNGLL